MANVYVYHAAAGAGTGADWANAYTTLAAAFTGGAAGDTFWVANDHAETQASAMTITPKGTAAAPSRVICALRTGGSVPPVSADLRTTATITTTGNNAITISAASVVCHFEGLTFANGTGAVNAALTISGNDFRHNYKNCNFKKLGTTASASAMAIGTARSRITMENCTFELGNVTDAVAFGGKVIWENTAAAIVNPVLTSGFLAPGNVSSDVTIRGVDLSKLTPGTSTLVRAMGNPVHEIYMVNCKLGASVVVAAAPTITGPQVNLLNCDSGDTNYRSERHTYQGVLTTETTTVRTGGASDGTTTIAWKIVPTANNERDFPFSTFPIAIWNETVGSVTLTIEGTWAGGAVPTTADIWMEVEHLDTSGFPLSVGTSFGPADSLAAGTNHATSTETWGAGGTTKFKMAATITPAEKGPIYVTIKYANASNTVWIDPEITVS
jgi:hypothetical protein